MDDSRPYGRRAFLGIVAGGLAALAWGEPAWRWLTTTTGVSKGWRIYTVADTMPVFDRTTWRLRIDGLVERPVELSYDDLRSLPRAEQVSDFHCVTGWSVEDVRWAGVRFRDLLAEARPLSFAKALRFVSAEEPYTDSLTLDQVFLRDAMLAYEMDGQPLSRPHGAPVRVVIPEMYGYKNVKWVRQIELVAEPADGYWEAYGYDRNAWVGRSNGYHDEKYPRA